MDWLVGMDLSDRGQGAIAYAAWLRTALRSGDAADRFHGVHVLEEAALQPMLRYHHLEEIERQAREASDAAVKGAAEGFAFDEQRLVHGRSAEHTLGELAGGEGVRGLIIGRQAKRGERRFVRLGRVARRLLRELHAPTIVVPPDLRPGSVGAGPVLLAASTDADGTAAAAFARQLADDLGRPLAVAHVVNIAPYFIGDTMPVAINGDLLRELKDKHEHRLSVWMQMHDLLGVPHYVLEGSVVDGLAELAREHQAPLVVCGSRGLGLGMRLFTSSVASDLAGACEIPVAVVPAPPEQ